MTIRMPHNASRWRHHPGRGAWLSMATLGSALLSTPGIAQQGRTYPALESFFRLAEPRVWIGTNDVEGPTLFGDIRGVSLDGRGNIYVLDKSDHTIRAFDASGRHLASIGRPGRGPGDLRDPIGLWHDGAGALFVVDRYDGISHFTTTGDRLAYRARIGAERRPSATCGTNDDLVTAGYRDGHILHVVSRAGRWQRSFGDRFRVDTIPGIQEIYDLGELLVACDGQTGRVFVAEVFQALVRSYDTAGRLVWQTELPDYDGSSVFINRNPRGIATAAGKFSTRALTFLGADLLLVQARHETRRRNPSTGGLIITESGVVTYVLSASRGALLTKQAGLPLLAMERGGNVVGFIQEPFPQVFRTRLVFPR